MKTKLAAKKVFFRRAILSASIIGTMAISGSASAFKIDSDNPDLAINWDNTFRYNAGWRMQDAADYQMGNLVVGPSESKWKSGDMVTNRVDLLSEFDFIYKKNSGFRISAAAWYDTVYGGSAPQGGPCVAGAPPCTTWGQTYFPNGDWPAEIQRYYAGPSGEFLDAFVFTKFDLGDVPVNVKLGKHTIYWGEALFSIVNSISVGQAPLDLRKATANPGIEAKEIFLPLNQLSFSAQISPEFTVMGQYFFDWKPDRLMMGGTYFSVSDRLWENNNIAGIWAGNVTKPKDKSGDWGLAARWRPDWLDGTAGLYYREFTTKAGRQLLVNAANFTPGFTWDTDAPRTKLIGVSLAKQIWGISWGAELTHRTDALLFSSPFNVWNDPAGAFTTTGQPAPATGFVPIGDQWTGILNMIAFDGKRDLFGMPLYDSAVLTAEYEYGKVAKVTKNGANWFTSGNPANWAFGASCTSAAGGARGGCATNWSHGINILFDPKWFQVFPGIDIDMPMYYGVGLHGNSWSYGPVEGAGAFSVGLAADVDAKYNFKIQYNGFILKHNPGPAANAGLGDFSHKGWLSFTAKASW